MTIRLCIIYIVIFFASSINVAAQETNAVRLSVADSKTHQPIGDVICKVTDTEGNMLSYNMTNGEGKVELNCTAGSRITLSLIGYAKKTMLVSSLNKSVENKILLTPTATALREVIVKAPPISSKNDTLIYNAAAFVGQEDRHLEDLLKKLPGITVADNGGISYQGKAISRFTIEGQDLLGSNYNQATRSMPVDAVSNVEVMEHNQNKKVLRDKAFEDRAAINVKIKKEFKFRPFGEVQGGIGLSPALWDNRLSLMQVNNNNQILLTGKMNNNGTDLSAEVGEHFDITDTDGYEPLPGELLSNSIMQLPFAKDWYLKNKSYSFGVNNIIKVGKDATLRANVLGYIDRSTRDDYSTNIYGGDNPVNLTEDNHQENSVQTYEPILNYELNADNAYLSDEFRYSFSINKYNQNLTSNNAPMNQLMRNKPWYLQNKINTTLSFGKNLYTVKSFIRYYQRGDMLDVSGDTTNTYNTSDAYTYKNFTTKNSVSTTFPLWRGSLAVSFNMNYKHNGYGKTDNDVAKSSANELNTALRPSYSLSYNGHNGNISVSLPIAWNDISLYLPAHNGKHSRYFYIAPSLSVFHKFNSQTELTFNASRDVSNVPEMFYSAASIRQDYRTIYYSASDIFKQISSYASLNFSYRNLVTMFFTNCMVMYSYTENEFTPNINYTPTQTIITTVSGKGNSKNFYATAMADKTFIDCGLSFKGQVNYNLTTLPVSQDATKFINSMNTVNASLTTTFKKIKWFKAIANIATTLNWQNNQYDYSTLIHSYNGDITLLFFPMKTIDISAKFQNYTNEINRAKYKSVNMLSVNARYKMNKSFEFGLNLSNLFNYDSYSVTNYTNINRLTNTIPLNGRRLMFTCVYRI